MGFEDEDELVGENKLEYRIGTKKIVTIFNQNRDICFENPCFHAYIICGCQGISEESYNENKGNANIIKRIACRA